MSSSIASHLSHPKYRPDIDGLRAIAIIAVVWFHAYPSSLRSGFIGVDIFFVISGFLISSIIFSNLERGTFSFGEFYIRRIRRILPALTTVMLSSLIFGWFALTAQEYKQLGEHLAGGAAFISNFLLWSESGYFDTAAETKPMLHLWSLAIEEQFYIFWPLLMALAWRKHKSFLTIMLMIAVASFAFSIYQIGYDKSAAFYSPLTRIWELMAGGILAYISLHRPALINRYPNQQSFIGFILLVVGLIVINRWHAFPGWWVLLPVLGTVLLISAGPNAWVNRKLISNRPLVWVGLISFPLYLWHWPILSFIKILKSQEPSWQLSLIAVLASFLLAWLTFKFIEAPCRFGKAKHTISALLLLLLAAIGTAGYLTYANNGFESRKSAPSLHEVNRGDIGNPAYHAELKIFFPCTEKTLLKSSMPGGCLHSQQTSATDVAIIGDSHAQHLYLGIANSAKNSNVLLFMQDGLPTLDDKGFHDVLNHVMQTPSISKVVLTAFWSWRIKGAEKTTQFERSFRETVAALTAANKSVYVIAADIPNFSFDPSKCKYSGRLGLGFGPVNQCSESSATFYKEREKYEALIKRSVEPHEKLQLIDLSTFFCDSETCSMARDGELYYRDKNHLNAIGSNYVGQKIVELIGID